ncbi:MAG: response regulator [Acidobacteria bacterium]|nr:response regulator [Acidobacteriota bacterium]
MDGRILIVDDDAAVRTALERTLSGEGLTVEAVSDAFQALDRLDQRPQDAVLLDLKMPGMDGTELLGILKSEHKHLEVVMLTGHGSLESAVECTKLGAFGYLPKPYELDELLLVLKDAYEARLKKKFEHDEMRNEKIAELAVGSSPLAILRALRELDDDEK